MNSILLTNSLESLNKIEGFENNLQGTDQY